MKLSYNITAHFTTAQIEEILTEYIARENNAHVDSIQFDVTKELCGYGLSERECVTFKGATIRIGDKIEGATARSQG